MQYITYTFINFMITMTNAHNVWLVLCVLRINILFFRLWGCPCNKPLSYEISLTSQRLKVNIKEIYNQRKIFALQYVTCMIVCGSIGAGYVVPNLAVINSFSCKHTIEKVALCVGKATQKYIFIAITMYVKL